MVIPSGQEKYERGMSPFDSPREWSRRCFLALLAASPTLAQSSGGKGQSFPSEAKRYTDPATEFVLTRLTDPAHDNFLTAYYNRGITQGNALLHASDRTGTLQVFRTDLKSGASHQLTSAAKLDPSSIALLPGDHNFCYFDDRTLWYASTSGSRQRAVYEIPEGTERGHGFSVAPDGGRGFFIERSGGKSRLTMISLLKGTPSTLAESDDELSDPVARPQIGHVLYRRNGSSLWLAHYDAREAQQLRVAPGGIGPAYWSADAKSLLYLNLPEQRDQLNNIRDFVPETGEDKMVDKTSQFVAFSCNADDSVFVGASGSKASPHVLILLRTPHRELTLCEHRASDPARVAPVFTPNSQRVVFLSDRQGKFAIYTLPIERFVEETA